MTNPFMQGFNAGKSGKSIFDCPYVKANKPYEFRQWFLGFDASRRKEQTP